MDAARRLAGPVALAALAVLYLHTLGRPSLWFDEAWEANYYVGYADAPWYNRPILYMSVEKAVVRALGPSEFALRLLPCLAGLAAVGVTFVLVRREAGAAAAWGAAALLALAPPFLFHAHELKNYSLDALFAVLLVLLWTRWRASRTRGRLLAFAAAARCTKRRAGSTKARAPPRRLACRNRPAAMQAPAAMEETFPVSTRKRSSVRWSSQ